MRDEYVYILSKTEDMIDNAIFNCNLFFEKSEDNVKEYIIHCTAIFSNTSVVHRGVRIDKNHSNNTLEVTIKIGIDKGIPSLELPTYVQNTVSLGKMPQERQHGDIEIYYETPTSGPKRMLPDREPKAKVTTSSAREKMK